MTLTVAEAQQRFVSQLSCALRVEHVPLRSALGRIAATDVISELDVPPSDNSAMDGFAVRSGDIQSERTVLPISDRLPAGGPQGVLQPASAARIFTGASVPEGADAVVIQENCKYSDSSDQVEILGLVRPAQNIRPRGQDISCGDTVVSRGRRLNPVDLGLLASVGQTEVAVYQRLRVAIFSTGNELAEPGDTLQAGQIYNSNRTMLLALCDQLGYQAIDCGIVDDGLDETKQALIKAAEQADLVISSGGVSVGEEDHIRPAVEALGHLQHWKVNMKPGKPVVFGEISDTPFLGLPGNPVSSYIVFQLIALPVMRALQGDSTELPSSFKVRSSFSKPSVSREEYIRVQLHGGRNQGIEPSVDLFDNQSSGVLFSLAWADGLVRQNIDQAIEKGKLVDYLPLTNGLL